MANADRLMSTGMPAMQAQEVVKQIEGGGGAGTVAWADVTGKPSTFTPTIGTTATTAKAGDYAPAWGDVTGKPTTFPAVTPVATATALATGRTFSLTGGATGTSAAFTGAANATIAVTLATPTATVRGGVLAGAAVANATDEASAITQLNALLASLRASGALLT